MRTSLSLLPPMGEIISVIGDPVRGAGWYGPTSGFHSLCIRVLNFQGRISIQGSIAVAPSNDDWFSVLPGGVAYWQYPRTDYVLRPPATGETSNVGFNFVCNAIWLRASVDRSYFATGDTPWQLKYFGVVDSIFVNY